MNDRGNDPTGTVPLVHVTRGGVVESVHRGIAVIADAEGGVVEAWGEASRPVVLRSAAKPFQAAWFVASGAAGALGATDEEIAVAAGSHGGAPEHVAAVRSLMARGGVTEAMLGCGVHPPFDAAARLALRGAPASVLQNNCSGKHAAMLAGARHLGLPADAYLDPDHAWQRGIRDLLAGVAGLEPEEVGSVTDGCSAPSFVLPAAAAALAYARLAAGDDPALARVFAAGVGHPAMIAGEGRLETALMELRPGVVLAKGGAEGVFALAVRVPAGADPDSGRALGAFVKIEDGDAQRARPAVAIALARLLLGLSDDETAELRRRFTPPLLTLSGVEVGAVRPLL